MQEAECIVVGGASGLSAAGGGDFYYSDTPSFREHFGKFADKYGFKGAFSGMMHRFSTRNEHWGYVATFLNTTQNALSENHIWIWIESCRKGFSYLND